jgi:hypothetical protein
LGNRKVGKLRAKRQIAGHLDRNPLVADRAAVLVWIDGAGNSVQIRGGRRDKGPNKQVLATISFGALPIVEILFHPALSLDLSTCELPVEILGDVIQSLAKKGGAGTSE